MISSMIKFIKCIGAWMRTVKAYVYSRVSSMQQVDAFGLDRQISTVMDFLENAKLPDELGYRLDPNNYEVRKWQRIVGL